MEGLELLEFLVEGTGLPAGPVKAEISRILTRHNLDPDQLTLDDIRQVLADYLQEVLLTAKQDLTL